MKPEAEIRRALREWVVSHGRGVTEKTLSDETPLLERRVITSLQIMDLILLVEELSGKRIDVQQLKPGVFHNINAIMLRFFGEMN